MLKNSYKFSSIKNYHIDKNAEFVKNILMDMIFFFNKNKKYQQYVLTTAKRCDILYLYGLEGKFL